MPSYSTFGSEELAKLVAQGEDKAFFELSSRYGGMIRDILSSVNTDSDTKEDLYQEGLIGLYRAAHTFDAEKGASFSTYAQICVKHSVYSSLRVYFSKRNDPVRSSSPFDEVSAAECPDLCTEPEKLLIEKENIRLIMKSVDTALSEYERRVFKLFLKGLSYEECAAILSTTPKSVDNAIQRIRGKLKKFVK